MICINGISIANQPETIATKAEKIVPSFVKKGVNGYFQNQYKNFAEGIKSIPTMTPLPMNLDKNLIFHLANDAQIEFVDIQKKCHREIYNIDNIMRFYAQIKNGNTQAIIPFQRILNEISICSRSFESVLNELYSNVDLDDVFIHNPIIQPFYYLSQKLFNPKFMDESRLNLNKILSDAKIMKPEESVALSRELLSTYASSSIFSTAIENENYIGTGKFFEIGKQTFNVIVDNFAKTYRDINLVDGPVNHEIRANLTAVKNKAKNDSDFLYTIRLDLINDLFKKEIYEFLKDIQKAYASALNPNEPKGSPKAQCLIDTIQSFNNDNFKNDPKFKSSSLIIHINDTNKQITSWIPLIINHFNNGVTPPCMIENKFSDLDYLLYQWAFGYLASKKPEFFKTLYKKQYIQAFSNSLKQPLIGFGFNNLRMLDVKCTKINSTSTYGFPSGVEILNR
jgi:hypothetical protein